MVVVVLLVLTVGKRVGLTVVGVIVVAKVEFLVVVVGWTEIG